MPTYEDGMLERTKPYLKPNQVSERNDDLKRLRSMLEAPPHIRDQVTDKGAVVRQMRSIERDLHENVPKPYPSEQVDTMVAREQTLRDDITTGMPTQEEMRLMPTGAVDKHMNWEQRNKKKILEWRNIRRRLHAGGQMGDGAESNDVGNLEHFRPHRASHELNMDSTVVPRTRYHIPKDVEVRNVASDDERESLLAHQRDADAPPTEME